MSEHRRLRTRELAAGETLHGLSEETDILLLPGQKKDRYRIGFATSPACVEAVQRLRFQVFNLELDEGLAASYSDGRDRDEFDAQMTHLALQDEKTGEIVGTYRLQTVRHGLDHRGLYSAGEFDLTGLDPYVDNSIECGRACIAEGHRTFATLLLLWRGIGEFMKFHGSRWLIGCCSLTSREPDDGWRAMKTIRDRDLLHPSLHFAARSDYSCGAAGREFEPDLGTPLPLPKLFNTYMKLGARVVSEPAIDRAFGTVDFLILMDSSKVTLSSLEIPR